MPCKCKEKTPETAQTPCPDVTEESFRQAFLRESAKTSQLAAQSHELSKRIEITEQKAVVHLQKLESQLNSHRQLLFDLMQMAPPELRELFKKRYVNLVDGSKLR